MPERIVLDVSAGLAVLAHLLDEAETLNQTEAQGIGVICRLFSEKLEQAGGELLDALIERPKAA